MSLLGEGLMRVLRNLGLSITQKKLRKVIKGCTGSSESLKSQMKK
jgi:hypothetical protein